VVDKIIFAESSILDSLIKTFNDNYVDNTLQRLLIKPQQIIKSFTWLWEEYCC